MKNPRLKREQPNEDATGRKPVANDKPRSRPVSQGGERVEGRTVLRIAILDAATQRLVDEAVVKEVGAMFLREGNLERVLTETVKAAIAISKADFGQIQLLDPKTAELKLVAQQGFPDWWLACWETVSRGQGTCGTALEHGERVIVDDVERSPIFRGSPALEIQLRAGVRAVQSTPLISRSGEPLGMFSTHYKRPHRPGERELGLLDLLARQTADIIERARSEQTLREHEEQLRRASDFDEAVLNNLGEGVYTTDEEGRVTFMNPAAEERLGWTFAELRGQNMHEMIHHHHRDGRPFPASECASLQVLKRGQRLQNHEDVFIRKDGTFFDVASTVAPLRRADGGIAGRVVVFTDITARKQAECRRTAALAVTTILAEAQSVTAADSALLRAIGETLGWELGAKWEVDPERRELFCANVWGTSSTKAESFHGASSALRLPPGEGLPGRVWRDLAPAWISDVGLDPNSMRQSSVLAAGLRSGFAFAIRSGEMFLGVIEFFSRHLRAPDVELLSMAESIGSQFGQFIQRKSAEQALRENQERLAGIVGSAMDAIISVDEKHRVILFNAAAETVFGCPAARAVGQPIDRFIPERFRLADEAQIAHFAQNGVTSGRMCTVGEISGLRANGQKFPMEASISQIKMGPRRLFTVVLRDISARKQAEEVIRKLNEDLEQRVAERTLELAQANQTLLMISECNQALVRITDEQQLIREVCRIIHYTGGYGLAWVGFAESDRRRTIRPVASVGVEADGLDSVQLTWADTKSGRGPIGTAIRTGKICQGEDFALEPNQAPWRKGRPHGFRSSIALPLTASGQAFGALAVYAPQAHAFHPAQVSLFSELARNLSFGITALRVQADRDLARRGLEQRGTQLRALAAELAQAEQRERRRIAQVLHDELQQLLVGARYRLDSLQRGSKPKDFTCTKNRVDELLDQCLETSRSLSSALCPPILLDGNLVDALRWLGRWFHDTHGLTVKVMADNRTIEVPDDLRVTLFQAVRELLFNVVKHAHVQQARVQVQSLSDNLVKIVVSDRGAGFDPARLKTIGSRCGLGLFSLQERLDFLGARVQVQSAPGKGSRFTLFVPLEKRIGVIRDP